MKIFYILTVLTCFGFYSFGKNITYDCKLNQFDKKTSSYVQIDSGSVTFVNFPEQGNFVDLNANAQIQASVGSGVMSNDEYAIHAIIYIGSLSDSVSVWAKIGSPIEVLTHGVHLKCSVK